MSSIASSSIVFAIVFGGALLGMFLRKLLPQNHLSGDSKGIVMIAMGLVATMALVLGLLVSSARSSFDVLSHEITGTLSDIILLDRTLALYGTETREARNLLRGAVANGLDAMETKKNVAPAHLPVSTRDTDSIFEKIQGLSPNDRQRSLKADALSTLREIQHTRWLMYEQGASLRYPTQCLSS